MEKQIQKLFADLYIYYFDHIKDEDQRRYIDLLWPGIVKKVSLHLQKMIENKTYNLYDFVSIDSMFTFLFNVGERYKWYFDFKDENCDLFKEIYYNNFKNKKAEDITERWISQECSHFGGQLASRYTLAVRDVK